MDNVAQGYSTGDVSVSVELKLLEAEYIELQVAVGERDRVAILDEAVDVIYRVEELATRYGITRSMLSEYAQLKGRVRACVGKDKRMELLIAAGVLSSHSKDLQC